MKETINISLSGIAFNLESEGYTKLNNYLSSIKNSYDNPAEVEELLSDIEARITELILNKQSAAVPVSEQLIDEIIAQLGFPIDEEVKQQRPPKYEPAPEEPKRIISKRLYRNPTGAMFGGVCGGLASYFNIDPVIIRLVFALALLCSWGLGIWTSGAFVFGFNLTVFVLYLVLWIVIPKARTPRQFLEMQGEPITKDNMERFLKDEMIDVDTNISRITRSERSATLLSSIFVIIGKIIKFFLYVIGSLIMLGICAAIITGIGFVIYGFTACHTYFANLLTGNIYVNVIAALAIGLVPLLMLLFVLIRPIFKIYPNRLFYIILWSLWIVAIVYGTFVAFRTIARYKYAEVFTEDVKMTIKGGTLYLKPLDPEAGSYPPTESLLMDSDMIAAQYIYLNDCDRHKLTDSTVTIQFKRSVRGNTYKETYQKAKNDIEYRIEGDTLFVNNFMQFNAADDILNKSSVIIHKPSHLKYEKDNRLKHQYERRYSYYDHD